MMTCIITTTKERTADTVDTTSAAVHNRFKEIYREAVFQMLWGETIDPDLDAYHEIVKILSKELGIRYGRKKKKNQ